MRFDRLKSIFLPRQKPLAPPALTPALRAQLVEALAKIREPVDIVASLEEGAASQEMRALLDEIAGLCEKIRVRHDGEDARRPSFSIARSGEVARVAFAAIPLGHELSSLVLALVQAGGHPPRVEPAALEAIRAISATASFETYITLGCHNCPELVQSLNLIALMNPRIRHTTIDGMLFRKEIDRHRIVAVPALYRDGEFFAQGRKSLDELVATLASRPRSHGMGEPAGNAGAAD